MPIAQLRRGDSPRLDGEDARHIEVLSQTDGPLPPILVHRTTMRVIDGMHRLRAAELKGQTVIEVRFFDGDEVKSFIESVRRNREHGLPLTLADRQSAARRIIAYRPHLSDRTVAEMTGLAPRTVAVVRDQLDPLGGQARIGKDGRSRPLNSAAGRRIAGETIAERPDASLREIARVAGISLGTARDVRERIRRGEDPVPPMVQRHEEQSTASTRGSLANPVPEALPKWTGHRIPDRMQSKAKRDLEVLLRNLYNDPALRFSDAGRATLRWLSARVNRLDGWEEVVETLPSHCAYVVAELARNYGQEWLALASVVERQVDPAA